MNTAPNHLDNIQLIDTTTGEIIPTVTDTTTEITPITIEDLAVQYANAAAAAQPFLDTMADIKAKLLEALPIGNHPAGALTVTVKAGAKVLDAKKLEAAYPQNENPRFYKSAFDTAAAKRFVAPAVLEVYTRQNASSVVIK